MKSPQFSFARLSGADPVLRVEMSSTGEVAAFGDTYDEALLKSIMSANNFDFSKKSVLLSLGGQLNKAKFFEAAEILFKLGYKIYATDTTAEFLKEQGITCQTVRKASENSPNALDIINTKAVAFVVNLSQTGLKIEDQQLKRRITDGFRIRRASVDQQLPLFTDLHLARAFVKALGRHSLETLKVKAYKEYFKKEN